MTAKFVSNSISLKKTSFREYVQKVVGNKDNSTQSVKTASVKDEVKKQASETKPEEKVVEAKKEEVKTVEAKKEDAKVVEAKKEMPEGLKKFLEEKKDGKKDEKKEDKKDDKKEEMKEEKKDEKKEEKKEASENKSQKTAGFVVVSKLNKETKAMLKDYYSTIYPKEFVDALLGDY